MDRTPDAYHPTALAVNPERADRDGQQQRCPYPSDGPVRQRPLGRDKLNDA